MLLTTLPSPNHMHIPDGFLSMPILILCWILTAFFVGIALRRTQTELGSRQIPTMGVLTATIFAAQMLNFPVAGGTSGHLIGGALAAILLGPWAAVLIMTSVVTLQALIFLDGGLLALGANILFMGVLAPWAGYSVYRLLAGVEERLATFVAAWISVVIAATAVSLSLWLSGTVALPIVLRAMVAVHALIGIGEGLITLGILTFLRNTMPEQSTHTSAQPVHGVFSRSWRAGLTLAFILALLSPLASSWPDGLERVAEDTGFIGKAWDPLYNLLTDYTVPGLENPALSTIAAGLIGTALAFTVGYILARTLVNARPWATPK